MKKIIACLFVLVSLGEGSLVCFAQNNGKMPQGRILEGAPPLAEAAETVVPARNGSFELLRLSDSCSRLNDSLGAGSFFLKIDPYYFLFRNQSPESIDTFISGRFKITQETGKKYHALFAKAYSEHKTPAYEQFKEMAEQDLNLRDQIEKCNNSKCYYSLEREIEFTDSIHSDFLYHYVMKNGWPSLSNGSLYAGILAPHDQMHYNEYLPLVKKAIRDGKLDTAPLNAIAYWIANRRTIYATTMQINYSLEQNAVVRKKYVRYDVSSMLHNDMPPQVAEIKDFVAQHCPARIMLVSESHDIEQWQSMLASASAIKNDENAFSQLNIKLAAVDCGLDAETKEAMKAGLWGITRLPVEHPEQKIFLYVKYDREDTGYLDAVSADFHKLVTRKKFVTRAINFNTGQSTIKPESMDYINQLADFLKTNPAIKLEIDGHTDSDGDAISNVALSQHRAEEVKKTLVGMGIAETRLTTKGFGAAKPLKPNNTAEGKAYNRRVEFIKMLAAIIVR